METVSVALLPTQFSVSQLTQVQKTANVLTHAEEAALSNTLPNALHKVFTIRTPVKK